MTQKHHIMHGRDHAPGGADPIPGAGGAGHTIQDEGVDVATQRPYLNFVGGGVHAYDDGTATVVSVTPPATSTPVMKLARYVTAAPLFTVGSLYTVTPTNWQFDSFSDINTVGRGSFSIYSPAGAPTVKIIASNDPWGTLYEAMCLATWGAAGLPTSVSPPHFTIQALDASGAIISGPYPLILSVQESTIRTSPTGGYNSAAARIFLQHNIGYGTGPNGQGFFKIRVSVDLYSDPAGQPVTVNVAMIRASYPPWWTGYVPD